MRVLVTGAARGLGFSLSRRFLEEGGVVFAGVKSLSALSGLSQLKREFPNTLRIHELDVRDEGSVRRCRDQIVDETPCLDGIINNAGVLKGRAHRIADVSLSDFDETFDTNTWGPVRVVKHFSDLLQQGGRSFIINVSSEAGSLTTCGSDNYSYCMSKAALNMFSHILRNELRGCVRVYALHPGRMRTDMGVPDFPLHPDETATAVFRLVTGELSVREDDWFINLYGEAMPM